MKILIIDDEKSIRFSLQISLGKMGHEIFVAETGEEGLEDFRKYNPEIAIVDIKLPGIDGIQVLQEIKKYKKECLVIMITYLSEVRLAVEAMKMGAYDYFTKPFDLDEIKDTVNQAANYLMIKRQIEKSDNSLNTDLIGRSKAISEIKEVIKKISNLNFSTTVLIIGESGTGKEVIARAIHYSGVRAKRPFIALNCAAIPKTLQESELFGYEKGAFSDAKVSKKGMIEEADGGTLFLDEIADMDLSLQAKLLRTIQEKTFRRLGSNKEKTFDAHIVCATNKDLLKEIKEGRFREDLFYRLNVVPINIPPLRERIEDIELLAVEFIKIYNNKLNKNVAGISSGAIEILKRYKWPGNVREMKNLIERVMIFKEDSTDICEDDLPLEILTQDVDEDYDKNLNLENVEREAILTSLEKNSWNISRTAEELGISRLTLRRKIKRYNIK
ncbi:sigma-54-dependent Fis family transcriptional regulator [Biomaibacter acetigenes]|uniref:Stage 0 sporulation protein A homolog n=1 Tax=Biomaibacter acetigenes TaxID=2316383 RepID=A0A3G2R7J6_9FIRM|nr:sigma-54 dependent transcriptional regulator [Biomaibacter acetigenes]AYO31406.1 sigma-54-dependent Fis family transcriptional regulator [Biomaibacter acetigenes]